jgi:glycosyltransferase involved in cell wall biosynthesis
MRILQINTTAVGGGAGLVMLRLHAAWRARGAQATVLAQHRRPEQAGEGVVSIPELLGQDEGRARRLAHLAAGRAERWLGWPQFHTTTRRLPATRLWREADLVHLHNLHGEYFNYEHVPALARSKPLVWTLHDMWALTGGCTFTRDCERWETGCHHCPQLAAINQLRRYPWLHPPDRTRPVWRAKARAFGQVRTHVVAPSRFVYERAQRSILRGHHLHHIPNGVDLEKFRPLDQAAARAALGLPAEARVVFFTAATIGNRRKGFAQLQQALAQLPQARDWWVLTAGSDGRGVGAKHPGPYLGLGFVSDDERMNLAFNAADVVALPTLAENHPLVLLEALATGTPAVAFDTGGVPEIARHAETGYVARFADVADLARGLTWVLEDDERLRAMGARSRALAEAEFGEARMIEKYWEVYEAAVEEFRGARA